MKYLIAGLVILVGGCTNTVEVEDIREYKCGNQIIKAEFLDDDSIILQINSDNQVLNKVKTASGMRYENYLNKITFFKQDGYYYLTIDEQNYPMCLRIER